MRFKKWSRTLTLAGLLSVIVPPGLAAEVGGIDFKGSGFLTLAAGTILNGSATQNASGYNCPCFISDYAQAGIYEKGGLKWQPDSKLGLQGSATFNDRFSLTGQVVMRGADGGQFDFEWFYGNIKFNDNLTLQVGRKRLPLFYYSESQDVGLSFPWVHLPPQLYGWEIVNYNGANLLYKDQWGDWSSGMNFFTGNETVNGSDYWKIYYGKDSISNSRWSNIIGADLSLSKDWFEARLLHIQSSMHNALPPPPLEFVDNNLQKIYGISFNADYRQWVARSEFLYINRQGYYGGDHSQLYALGYHFGKLMPMLTFNGYQQSNAADQTQAEAHSTTSLLLRYDLTTSSAVKVQYDHWQNNAQPEYFSVNPNTVVPNGTVNLLSASYDRVF